jgi:hypothetical protein
MAFNKEYEEKILVKVELVEKILERVLVRISERLLKLEENVKDLNDFAINLSVRLGIKKEE